MADFASNYTANVGAKVTGSIILDVFNLVKRKTTQGRILKGRRRTSEAIMIITKHQDKIKAEDLAVLAHALHKLLSKGRGLAEKSNGKKWPWADLGTANEFANMAASLRDAAVHTSEEAALSKFMTAVEDRDYREFVLDELEHVICRLRGDAVTDPTPPNGSAVGPDPFNDPTTPKSVNFLKSTDTYDQQTTPTAASFSADTSSPANLSLPYHPLMPPVVPTP